MSFQEYADSASHDGYLKGISKKRNIGIACIALVAVLVSLFGIISNFGVLNSDNSQEEPELVISDTSVEEESSDVCVYVTGCVVEPGVVYLPQGSRVADAISAVGGFSDNADIASINLAEIIDDGIQINIPSIVEIQAQSSGSVDGELGSSTTSSGMTSNGKININTASVSDLMTLDGIGQSKAEKIIAYRESNGKFKSVDDLVNVSGIGEKTLDSLRDSICV